jgi:hypothetical protein
MSAYRATIEMSIEAADFQDALAELLAYLKDKRYWLDHKGNIRRFPGMKPILSHGKRSRR